MTGADDMTTDVEQRAESLKSKLELATRQKLRPFGWEQHRFELLPRVTPLELNEFESRHHVVLPDEYRAFIALVGRGGAGPAYGLIPFERIVSADLDPASTAVLSTPFPFEHEVFPNPAPMEKDGRVDARELRGTAGTLAICHEGCGYLHLLVCSGSQRGRMWLDSTVSDGPYSPFGLGFFDWYERWLDDVLAGRSGNWWLRSETDSDPDFQRAMRDVKP
jgi:hypothetical protein